MFIEMLRFNQNPRFDIHVGVVAQVLFGWGSWRHREPHISSKKKNHLEEDLTYVITILEDDRT